jgi:predicted dehydrogenase
MLNFALVGCGKIAKRHSDLLGLKKINGANLVAVCDMVEENAKNIANKFSIPFFTNMNDMMSDNNLDIDVVVVLTASGNHAKDVTELAKYGKHIVVEKPMSLTLNDADQMIHACDKAGIRLFVIKQNRFNVPIMKLKEAIDSGRFGKLVLGTVRVRWCRKQDYYDQNPWRGTWAMDGGVLTNQASHHIDLLEWMFGEVESVFAISSTALANIEAEDTAVVNIKFKNGALGIIEATTAVRPSDLEGSISVMGEGGSVIVGGFAANELKIWNFENEIPEDNEMFDKYSRNPENEIGYAHQAYYEHVVDCINNNKQQLIDGLEGRKSLELINAIYESIETEKKVNVRFAPKFCKLGQKRS